MKCYVLNNPEEKFDESMERQEVSEQVSEKLLALTEEYVVFEEYCEQDVARTDSGVDGSVDSGSYKHRISAEDMVVCGDKVIGYVFRSKMFRDPFRGAEKVLLAEEHYSEPSFPGTDRDTDIWFYMVRGDMCKAYCR